MKIEYLPFTEKMIPEAGRLLAERHTRNRKSLSLLPARFEDDKSAIEAVQALWKKKLKGGYAAFRDGRMIAYLIGEFTVQPWARSGYVYLPGYDLADGEKVEIIQDLYALLGEDWVRKGVFSHNLYISAADKNVIDGLFSIGFGQERIDALLDLRSLEIPKLDIPENMAVRPVGKGDEERLKSISHFMMNALAAPPYWHPTSPEDYLELEEGWSELATDKDWKSVWMAVEDEQALGTVGFRPTDEDDPQMLIPPHTIYMGAAVTKPEARGRGVATILTWNGFDKARKDGFELCYTNWISPNLFAARFWPRFGFTRVSYRLSKQINPGIAWGRDE